MFGVERFSAYGITCISKNTVVVLSPLTGIVCLLSGAETAALNFNVQDSPTRITSHVLVGITLPSHSAGNVALTLSALTLELFNKIIQPSLGFENVKLTRQFASELWQETHFEEPGMTICFIDILAVSLPVLIDAA